MLPPLLLFRGSKRTISLLPESVFEKIATWLTDKFYSPPYHKTVRCFSMPAICKAAYSACTGKERRLGYARQHP